MENRPPRHFDLKRGVALNADGSMPAAADDAADDGVQNNQRRYLLNAANYRSIVEQQIQDAQERGDFDDLPGKGRPLTIEENPYAGDRELAYKLLKDNNFTLPWIAERNRLLERIADFRARLAYHWQLQGPQLRALLRAGQRPTAERRWIALTMQWQTSIDAINKDVYSHNMTLPVRSIEIYKLTLPSELTRAGIPTELDTLLATDAAPPADAPPA